jgi:chemotaxis signal transduction protein
MMKRTAAELAEEFDGAFAAAHAVPAPQADLLAIGIADDRFAIRLAQVAGMFADRRITKVPSRRADLLGLAAFRGTVLPVFDLAARLGYTAARTPRWLVLAAAAPVAFAFERFDGHMRLAASAIGDIVVLDGNSVPVIDIASIALVIAGETT